jgi:3-oxoacyl-[acyl-carrier-protein] synthase II
MTFGFKGPNFAVVSACASSSHAIGESFRMIKYGDADVVLTGGSEAPITPLSMAGFSNMRALSTRNNEPHRASRPFDRERDGFVIGEGAAALVLEELEHAKRRNAKIYAEIKGYGATCDAYHITAPDPEGEGAYWAMRLALEDGGVSPEEVDYINAHGTSTQLNDKIETAAIKRLFGEHSKRLWINSSKSMIGHLLGAAGAIEAVITVLSIARGKVHPTRNLEYPDPECDLDYVPEGMREKRIKYAITNSFGFGGHNAVLLFSALF